MIVFFPRIQTLGISAVFLACLSATPALAQQPTDEQRSAIRSSCRSDYMAHCASVPPGGLASLQCLQQNMASLSAACKSAVNAIAPKSEPKSEPKTEPKAEPAPAKAETPKAEPPKSQAEPAKPEPTKAAPAKAESAPEKESKPSTAKPSTTKPSAPPKGATAKPAASTAKPTITPAPQAAAPTPPLVLRPIRPLEEVRVLRFACGADARTLCSAVQPGGGRIIQCLASQPDALSSECRDVLGQFAAQ